MRRLHYSLKSLARNVTHWTKSVLFLSLFFGLSSAKALAPVATPPILDLNRVIALALTKAFRAGSTYDLSRSPALPREVKSFFKTYGYSLLQNFSYDPQTKTMAFMLGSIHSGLWDNYSNGDQNVFVVRWDSEKNRIQVLKNYSLKPELSSLDLGPTDARLFPANWLRIQSASLSPDTKDIQDVDSEDLSMPLQFINLETGQNFILQKLPQVRALGLTSIKPLFDSLYLAQTSEQKFQLIRFEALTRKVEIIHTNMDASISGALTKFPISEVVIKDRRPIALALMKREEADEASLKIYLDLTGTSPRLVDVSSYRRLIKDSQILQRDIRPALHRLGDSPRTETEIIELSQSLAESNLHKIKEVEDSYNEGRLSPGRVAWAIETLKDAGVKYEAYEDDLSRVYSEAMAITEKNQQEDNLKSLKSEMDYLVRWKDDDSIGIYPVLSDKAAAVIPVEGPRLRYEMESNETSFTLIDLYNGQRRTWKFSDFKSLKIRSGRVTCENLLMSKSKPW